jgi:hypothetical protein
MIKTLSAVIAAIIVTSFVACSNDTAKTDQKVTEKRTGDSAAITVDIFVKKACRATEPAIQLVRDILDNMDVSSELNIVLLKSHSRANELKVIGSPTIRVNGVDIDPAADQIRKYGLT